MRKIVLLLLALITVNLSAQKIKKDIEVDNHREITTYSIDFKSNQFTSDTNWLLKYNPETQEKDYKLWMTINTKQKISPINAPDQKICISTDKGNILEGINCTITTNKVGLYTMFMGNRGFTTCVFVIDLSEEQANQLSQEGIYCVRCNSSEPGQFFDIISKKSSLSKVLKEGYMNLLNYVATLQAEHTSPSISTMPMPQ